MSHLQPNAIENLGLGAPIGGGSSHTAHTGNDLTSNTGVNSGIQSTANAARSHGMDDDEHGAGMSGVAGGGTHAGRNAEVYQSGDAARGDGFSAGLSGEHTSGGLPHHGQTPIADKFTGHSTSAPGYDGASGAYAGSGTNNGLTGESHADSHFKDTSDLTGHSHSHAGAAGAGLAGAGLAGAGASHLGSSGRTTDQEGVSGTYSGVGTSHGLTGESHAQSHPHSNLAAGAGAAGLGVGALGAGAAAHEHSGRDHTSGLTGSGNNSGLAASQVSGTTNDETARGSHGLGAGAVGAGAAGAAGVGAGAHGLSGHNDDSKRHGRDEIDQPERGQPISKPEEIDSGTRHGLVWQESTGKYVHRHELEDDKTSRRA